MYTLFLLDTVASSQCNCEKKYDERGIAQLKWHFYEFRRFYEENKFIGNEICHLINIAIL